MNKKIVIVDILNQEVYFVKIKSLVNNYFNNIIDNNAKILYNIIKKVNIYAFIVC